MRRPRRLPPGLCRPNAGDPCSVCRCEASRQASNCANRLSGIFVLSRAAYPAHRHHNDRSAKSQRGTFAAAITVSHHLAVRRL